MKINTDYLSNKNSYEGQTPRYIVIHNTDNDNPGADARAHAKAQHDGNFDPGSLARRRGLRREAVRDSKQQELRRDRNVCTEGV